MHCHRLKDGCLMRDHGCKQQRLAGEQSIRVMASGCNSGKGSMQVDAMTHVASQVAGAALRAAVAAMAVPDDEDLL